MYHAHYSAVSALWCALNVHCLMVTRYVVIDGLCVLCYLGHAVF